MNRSASVLFQNQHSSCGLECASTQCVVMNAAGYGFTALLSASPVGSGSSGLIHPRFLHSEIQLTHPLSSNIVDAKGNVSVRRQAIG